MLDLRSIIRTTAENLRVELTDAEIEGIRDHAKYKHTDPAIIDAIEAGFEALNYRERQRR